MKTKLDALLTTSAKFAYMGHLGAEVFGLNLATCRINRIEAAPLSQALKLQAFGAFAVDHLDRHYLLDASRPELVGGGSITEISERLSSRKLRGMLEENVIAEQSPILGSLGPSVSYAGLTGNRPSTALIKVGRNFAIERSQRSGKLSATFPWGATLLSYPLLDTRSVATFPPEEDVIQNQRALGRLLGFRPTYVLIALARVHAGYCKKVVVKLLPEP